MKVLNLYAGIGGNRRLWTKENTGLDLEITAVELDPNIAKIYQDFFPDDNVVVGDAHQYLLDHYKEFDFIWTSPPCPTHSRARYWGSGGKKSKGKILPVYPDMKLYQEIIFLEYYFDGKWVAENVDPYYKPLIPAQPIGRHLFWSNFFIPKYSEPSFPKDSVSGLQELHGINLSHYKYNDKIKLLRNCVFPGFGLHIFNSMNNQELKLNL